MENLYISSTFWFEATLFIFQEISIIIKNFEIGENEGFCNYLPWSYTNLLKRIVIIQSFLKILSIFKSLGISEATRILQNSKSKWVDWAVLMYWKNA